MPRASPAASIGAPPVSARRTTRDTLIVAAERLFAQHGFEGVSLRQIGLAAGQRNTNAVRYHFGSREKLIEAIFEHRQIEFETTRRAILETIPRPFDRAAIPALLSIILLPPFAIPDEDERYSYIKLISAYLNRHRDSGMRHPLDYATTLLPVLVEARHALRNLLDLPADIFDFRIQMVVGMALQAVIQRRVRLAHDLSCPTEQALVADIMAIATAAMAAPCASIRTLDA